MAFSINFFNKFIDRICKLNANFERISESTAIEIGTARAENLKKRNILINSTIDSAMSNYEIKHSEIVNLRQKTDGEVLSFLAERSDSLLELAKCKVYLDIINEAKLSIEDEKQYEQYCESEYKGKLYVIEDFLNGSVDFFKLAFEVNKVLSDKKSPNKKSACATFNYACQTGVSLLSNRSNQIRQEIFQSKPSLMQKCFSLETTSNTELNKITKELEDYIVENRELVAKQLSVLQESEHLTISKLESDKAESLKSEQEEFLKAFPFMALAKEYDSIMAREPNYANYECVKDMPWSVCIGYVEHDISAYKFNNKTMLFLATYYGFMLSNNKLIIPHCVTFDNEFNFLFSANQEGVHSLIKDNMPKLACNFGMRLFMSFPPGKVVFTFLDPVSLGNSFAIFTRLVNLDDRTSEVINGKIWSSPEDIESKLRIMADHISGVTQRCLQGKYNNIFEYNKDAELNAEAYQVVMIMDYPAGLSDRSLKLLEQIAASGPKCGVFTVIFGSSDQRDKLPTRSYSLLGNLESHFTDFTVNSNDNIIFNQSNNGKLYLWRSTLIPSDSQMDSIIEKLKAGIKTRDRVVIGVEKVKKDETTETTLNGIRIPIGKYGADVNQYLTLGVGGSHHALVAGYSGMGKSNLLHVILLHALEQYSPNELEIYLVDFKRGVEFKIYANNRLPQFKVIAIESEPEFGYNILMELDRQQKIRAKKFRDLTTKTRVHIEDIETFRKYDPKTPMPRIMVIIDEFHELFSTNNDIGSDSTRLINTIVKQGRVFGIHLILASQSYSTIGSSCGIDFNQIAVRMVLKCSEADANMLLDNGASLVNQISINDAGRGVYNSEAGNNEYSNMFKAVYIRPDEHDDLLKRISEKYSNFPDSHPRILLSNIEDNNFCVFNRFADKGFSLEDGEQLFFGEPLVIDNRMKVAFSRSDCSNLMIVGANSENARNIFSFCLLSICIEYWLLHDKKPPALPIIYLMNFKPLKDSFFDDIPKIIAKEYLKNYIAYVNCSSAEEIRSVVETLYGETKGINADLDDKYLFVFGYQRAEELKVTHGKIDDLSGIGDIQNSVSTNSMMKTIIEAGPSIGIHTCIWQDSYKALSTENNDMISYFHMRVALEMPAEDLNAFVLENDVNTANENNAIYYNKIDDNQRIRVYQTPSIEWVKELCEKLDNGLS